MVKVSWRGRPSLYHSQWGQVVVSDDKWGASKWRGGVSADRELESARVMRLFFPAGSVGHEAYHKGLGAREAIIGSQNSKEWESKQVISLQGLSGARVDAEDSALGGVDVTKGIT